MLTKDELLSLSDSDLFFYMTEVIPDENYRSLVMLLLGGYFEGGLDHKQVLRKLIENDKVLVAVYPGDPDPENGEIITDIIDGTLYSIPKTT